MWLARLGGILGTVAALAAALPLVGCGRGEPAVEPGVPLALARERAGRLSALRYRLRFEIPAREEAEISARATITFDLAAAGEALQLDFRARADAVRRVSVNGEDCDCRPDAEHIILPASSLRRGRNEVDIDFIAGSGALNRNPGYLYTLFVPDRARTAFPLFDQPDLKARYELTLVLPAAWRALSNAPLVEVVAQGARREHRFAATDLLSPYQFSFVAGEFEAVTREVGKHRMTLLHRETDSDKVARNLDDIFALHAAAITWMEQYTGIDYPFDKFDFALIPGHPYGGMEHVGAIQYRAASLLLEENPPVTDLLNRATLIAHETAHMWFGNLVTMRWFDDVWTKEVFASFFADRMAAPAFPGIDHALDFLVSHYPRAYAVDRSEGANAIRQPLANLDQAGQLYGDIIYNKAPIMMRQLARVVGEDGFRRGLQEYLGTYAYGNATWPQLIAILDEYTDTDLAAWSEVWVNTAGRPVFRPGPPTVGATAVATVLQQQDPAGLGRVWPQEFTLLRLFADRAENESLRADTASTPVVLPPAGEPLVASLYNADGMGYGLFPADPAVFAVWERLLPLQRGAALINAYEQLLAGGLPGTEVYIDWLLVIIQGEADPLLLQLALGQLHFVYHSLLDDDLSRERTPAVEAALWRAMLAQPDGSGTKLLFRSFQGLVSSPARVQQLYAIWRGELVIDRLVLEEEDLTALAQTLAIRLPDQSAEIIRVQLSRIDNPDRRRRLQFIAPSLSADVAVRDAFFASLADERNRQTESWVVDALGNLHHPSRLREAEKYLLPGLEMLEEIQRTGDIFFPSDWLFASLANHHSPSAVQTVRQFLARRPDYNPQLRMKILQEADPLFRAAAIRGAQQ